MTEELIGIIGGTGLGDALAQQLSDGKFINVDTPFGKPSMPDSDRYHRQKEGRVFKSAWQRTQTFTKRSAIRRQHLRT